MKTAKKDKHNPNPSGREGRPLSLAPMTETDVLRKLLSVKPETLAELKKQKKAKAIKKG